MNRSTNAQVFGDRWAAFCTFTSPAFSKSSHDAVNFVSRSCILSQTPSTDGRGAFQDPTHVSFWNSNSFCYHTRADQNRFIDCPVRFQANRLKNFFPSEWHREHQIVYVKADLLKVAGRVPGGVAI